MNNAVATRDFTERWSCREGDFVLWLKASNVMAREQDLSLADWWYMRDGQYILASKRTVDFPSWFELHPTEACDTEVDRVTAKLDAGWVPGDPVHGPNIWRVCAGDRIVWVGRRNGTHPEIDGVLRVLDCHHSILVTGEGLREDLEEWKTFGTPRVEDPTDDQKRRILAGMAAAKELGLPRRLATEWLIG